MAEPTREAVLARIRARDPALAAQLAEHPEIAQAEIQLRKQYYPSKDFVPNVAQERALAPFRAKDDSYGDFPFGTIFTGGNGVGKTAALAILLAGCGLGKRFLHPEFFGNHAYFDYCEEIRSRRRLKVRLVCDAADMEEGGSVYEEIRTWIPVAKFEDMKSKYYSTIIIPSPIPGYHPTYIQVRTHAQDIVSHAGPTLDLILFNEPCPFKLWGENIARLRGTKDNPGGGRYAAFLTPLYMAAYLYDIVASGGDGGKIRHIQASVYENCKDVPGNRGIRARAEIENQIAEWERSNPLEVPARRDGKFMFLVGAVFQIYTEEHHVIPPEQVLSDWNIYQVVDPHPHKPHVALWIAVCPLNIFRVIAEYPTEDWTILTGTMLTLKDFCRQYRLIEAGKHPQYSYLPKLHVLERFGDPNAMKAEHPLNRKTVQQEYSYVGGLDYNIRVDNDIALRHNRIRDLLQYDPKRPVRDLNMPSLYIYASCSNMRRALTEYRYSVKQGQGAGLSDKLEETWKCWIDALGYALMSVDAWTETAGVGMAQDDYREYLEGLQPDGADREGGYEYEDSSILTRF